MLRALHVYAREYVCVGSCGCVFADVCRFVLTTGVVKLRRAIHLGVGGIRCVNNGGVNLWLMRPGARGVLVIARTGLRKHVVGVRRVVIKPLIQIYKYIHKCIYRYTYICIYIYIYIYI